MKKGLYHVSRSCRAASDSYIGRLASHLCFDLNPRHFKPSGGRGHSVESIKYKFKLRLVSRPAFLSIASVLHLQYSLLQQCLILVFQRTNNG